MSRAALLEGCPETMAAPWKNENTQIGIPSLDGDPDPAMEAAADKAGGFSYQLREDLLPQQHARLQIVTAHGIIDGAKVDCPQTSLQI
ncbi:MAG: hypothetical protein OXQ94_14635 [Gemmatimonadota bacterium]|nr:hypothetical protein [Gemmatimonadota bacterium]MDE2872912.1 hypothetical protein [Gemmatimonadota bacterium]